MPRQAKEEFDLRDYAHSDTAVVKGIDNAVPVVAADNIKALHENVVSEIVKIFGDVTITSGYRSPALNAAVGSHNNASQHTKGQAVDLVTSDLKALFNYILRNLPFDQIIYESYGGKRWVHVSYVDEGRRSMAMRTDDGKSFTPQEFFA